MTECVIMMAILCIGMVAAYCGGIEKGKLVERESQREGRKPKRNPAEDY